MTSIRTDAATQLDELAAEVARLAAHVANLQQTQAERAHADDGDDQPPLYSTVEDWVTMYLLPTFPRPVGEVGMTRWHWCEQWWRHDEAVTRLTALWYGWEQARLQMTGMLPWLRDLDHQLPILCGDDDPFRNCTPAGDLGKHQHRSSPEVPAQPAPEDWWKWWD
ncbi:DUF4913 domain-containing protein [Micromonospora sediminimaris]|uniref:DUF4913 domain-containing protein n=1 Tax=Micromonospora sediminimaris TaxID=547162 RepID=A0A9W5UVD6_9ACTN|nr:DUF4913 domain-containing protein [Micromonospora sediminimaris]GIJ35068.1 hypothetical protein Vse01_42160 [Micromonospora sediminimaris]SFD27298.1 protein of unknown function [Micromonospora sediminimaris]